MTTRTETTYLSCTIVSTIKTFLSGNSGEKIGLWLIPLSGCEMLPEGNPLQNNHFSIIKFPFKSLLMRPYLLDFKTVQFPFSKPKLGKICNFIHLKTSSYPIYTAMYI